MKKIMMLLFTLLFTGGLAFAQVPEGQPEQQKDIYEGQEGELEQEAPEQQPQQLEQEGETTAPGQEQPEQERQESEGESMEEADPMQQEGEASIDRFEQAKTMKYRQLPETVRNDLENGYFNDWEVKDVYAANEVPGNEEIPADFIIKVEKEDEIMNLYYQGNGELLMQEKAALHEEI